jgi:hypothetical protein
MFREGEYVMLDIEGHAVYPQFFPFPVCGIRCGIALVCEPHQEGDNKRHQENRQMPALYYRSHGAGFR